MHTVLNFGSLNIDHVYNVPHFVHPGETLSAQNYAVYPGGKGLNQSIALARAGINVKHAGRIGKDGLFLKDLLEKEHVDCSALVVSEQEPTGHAVIQVSSGENCIVLFGGANLQISQEQIDSTLSNVQSGDFLLLQNEISRIPDIIRSCASKGMRIFLNPAPMTSQVAEYPLEHVETLIVNETEGLAIAGYDLDISPDPDNIFSILHKRYPKMNLLMTLGAKGAVYFPSDGKTTKIFVPACHVEHVADTTAAGDTFIGYFLAGLAQDLTIEESMKMAAKASAVCVSRMGASCSIPYRGCIQ